MIQFCFLWTDLCMSQKKGDESICTYGRARRKRRAVTWQAYCLESAKPSPLSGDYVADIFESIDRNTENIS